MSSSTPSNDNDSTLVLPKPAPHHKIPSHPLPPPPPKTQSTDNTASSSANSSPQSTPQPSSSPSLPASPHAPASPSLPASPHAPVVRPARPLTCAVPANSIPGINNGPPAGVISSNTTLTCLEELAALIERKSAIINGCNAVESPDLLKLEEELMAVRKFTIARCTDQERLEFQKKELLWMLATYISPLTTKPNASPVTASGTPLPTPNNASKTKNSQMAQVVLKFLKNATPFPPPGEPLPDVETQIRRSLPNPIMKPPAPPSEEVAAQRRRRQALESPITIQQIVDAEGEMGAKLLDPRLEKKERICREILETEKSYVESLLIVQNYYENALREASPPIISPAEIDMIFSNIRHLSKYNQVLLTELKKKADPIGKIFALVTPFFKQYAEYSRNYNSSLEILKRLKRDNAAFRNFLEKQGKDHSEHKQVLDLLDSYLIRPIQRIPRYSLLLQDLINNSEEADPDLPNLKKAHDLMKDVGQAINESIKINENFTKVIAIQESLVFPKGVQIVELVSPSRIFIREGEVHDVRAKRAHFLFLFNDCLVITAKRLMSSSYYFCERLDLVSVSAYFKDAKPTKFKLSTPTGDITFTSNDSKGWADTLNKMKEEIFFKEVSRIQLMKEKTSQ